MAMPFKSRTAPLVIETVLDDAPKAAALPTFRVPAETVVLPEYVLEPDSVRAPVPVFTRLMAPVLLLITPVKLVLLLLPPTVSVAALIAVGVTFVL